VLTDCNSDIRWAKGLNHVPNLTVIFMDVKPGLQQFENSLRVLQSAVLRKLHGYKEVKFYLSTP
jgi:hypothetical protein